MTVGIAETLTALLGDFSVLAPRIKHLKFSTTACGDRIDVRCSYIAFRDGQPTFDDFVGVVSDHIIPFCIPRSEIRAAQTALSKGDHAAAGRLMTQLHNRARSLFIKAKEGSHRSGEAGEIVLYMLIEWLLKAPQIVSKMYLKTNNQMPVHGTDGIHARFDADSKKLHLYWGESKAHVKVESALASALDSVHEFVIGAQDEREITIVATHSDFDGFDADTKEAFLRYLDPYSAESNERIEAYCCLLLFEFNVPKGIKPEDAEAQFVDLIQKSAESFVATIQSAVDARGLGPQRFEFFLLPVPSVQGLRDKFQAKIGWPK